MKVWTIEEEATALRERFKGVNRAAFARDHQIKGGQAMIYQHITGRRPISIEAAMAYAAGFKCSLEEISPRLAIEAQKAAALSSEQPIVPIPSAPYWPFSTISEAEIRSLAPAQLNALEGALALAIAQLKLGIGPSPAHTSSSRTAPAGLVDMDAVADEFAPPASVIPPPWDGGPTTKQMEDAARRSPPQVSGAVSNIGPAEAHPANDDLVDVPELGDVRLAASIEGHENESEQQTGVMPFRRSFLRSVGADGSRGRVVYAKGDSMEPFINDGAALLVVLQEDLTVRNLVAGGIYAIRYDGKMMVKRVAKDKLTGKWVAQSLNPKYRDVTLENGVSVQLLGRVVWTGTRLT
ncbi:S24 family peptidase [Achromobacter deleyi]|nr:S24 family peptidase [Achromobacter deleyi]